MTTESERTNDAFYTKHGLRLRTITVDEYEEDRPTALTPTQIEENVIYEARGMSQRLEKIGAAISFNVMVGNLAPMNATLATRSFLLLSLDEDFQVVSSHKAKIRNDRLIENDPIVINRQRRLLFGAQIFQTYLVSNNDTTLDSILTTRSSLDTPVDDRILSSV